jgi:hypothetical protein
MFGIVLLLFATTARFLVLGHVDVLNVVGGVLRLRCYVLLFLIGDEVGTLGGLDSEYFVPLLLIKEQLLGGDCWYHWLPGRA